MTDLEKHAKQTNTADLWQQTFLSQELFTKFIPQLKCLNLNQAAGSNSNTETIRLRESHLLISDISWSDSQFLLFYTLLNPCSRLSEYLYTQPWSHYPTNVSLNAYSPSAAAQMQDNELDVLDLPADTDSTMITVFLSRKSCLSLWRKYKLII